MRPLIVVAALASATSVSAQDYPTRPINIVVPAAAGGPTDTISRITAQAMSKHLGQQITIENVGGAGGTIGTGRVVRAEPDGYTLLIYHVGLSTAATLYRKLPYDTKTALAPVGLVTDAPMTIIGRSDLEPNTLRRARRLSQGPQPPRPRSATPASARPRTCAECCSCRKCSSSSPPCRIAEPHR